MWVEGVEFVVQGLEFKVSGAKGLFGFQNVLELELYLKPTKNYMLWVYLYIAGVIVVPYRCM